MGTTVFLQPERIIGRRDPMIYGHFLEHFHREIYGGVYDPGSPLADSGGMRTDVIEAIRRIKPEVIRWPGGCFASAYHWQHGVGPKRQPYFDKAWRVEESNAFGTDEFVSFCREVEAEPYICTNAGTGSPQEMSDWVEYCNLEKGGRWASRRIENGHARPFGVKYWSIGNENYLGGEMGSKSLAEWGSYVRESAKMMKRVDPSIEIAAAGVATDWYYRTQRAFHSAADWNLKLLKEAGDYLDWISIHSYWDRRYRTERVNSPYEECMVYTLDIENRILFTRYALGLAGYLGKIRIAYDEWNLRGWYHPYVDSSTEDYLTPRDENDINSTYTMADAIFAACFLNQCLKHCDLVGMANFSPAVNARGAIFTHESGIVLRSTYRVFELFTKYMGEIVVDSWISDNESFDVEIDSQPVQVPALDCVATKRQDTGEICLSVVNRNPEKAAELSIDVPGEPAIKKAKFYTVSSSDKNDYNDIDRPDDVRIVESKPLSARDRRWSVELPAHSVSVVVLASPSR
jgi:alpha-N-arabinofuranosidase